MATGCCAILVNWCPLTFRKYFSLCETGLLCIVCGILKVKLRQEAVAKTK